MKWYNVPDIEEPDQPFLKKIKVAGKSICLVGYNKEIFALSSICPHAGGDLSKGWCEDGQLICPVHRYAYDVQTGKGITRKSDQLDVFPVEIREDGIYVGIPSILDKLRQAFQ
jgi:nitrite reductase/ring-hydroxylating ferredoxin subunit